MDTERGTQDDSQFAEKNLTNMAQRKTLTMLTPASLKREDKKPGGTKAEERRAREVERTWREGRAEREQKRKRIPRAGERVNEQTVEDRGG